MPYRRLPNTDLSRIAVLKRAIEKNGVKHNDQLVLSFRTIQEATNTLAVLTHKLRITKHLRRRLKQQGCIFLTSSK